MRTLVISDLHLGCGAAPGIFAGAGALSDLLAALAGPLRVVLNGDTFDFIAQAPHAAPESVHSHIRALFEDSRTTGVLALLVENLAGRGELLVRTGDHDHELASSSVQDLLRSRLGLATRSSPRLSFSTADTPTELRVGRARVVLTHALVDRGDPADRWLARNLLNPLRREFGVGLADLLRPDYPAAVLAALAVNPTAARHVFRQPLGEAAWHHLNGTGETPPALHLGEALTRAGLTAREQEVMTLALDPNASDGAHDRALDAARLKLFRAALAGHGGRARPTARTLSGPERTAARALARRARASAVIAGSTHAVGWSGEDDDLVILDTGTWAWIVELPAATDDATDWQRCLDEWQRTPRIGGRPGLASPICARLTGALLEPLSSGRGTLLALIEWREGRLVRLHERALAP